MVMDALLQQQKIRPTYGYYRQSNGWITVGVRTEIERMYYEREGWRFLTGYPAFDMNTQYGANHPLETLFMFGGAKELPVEQIEQMGLFMDPPLVPVCRQPITQYHKEHLQDCWVGAQPVEFPQLNGVHLQSYECRLCGTFKPTEAARDQHEAVAHKPEKSDIRTGEALAKALAQGLAGIVQPAQQTQAVTALPLHPFICGRCNEGFGTAYALLKHAKIIHREEDDGGA